VTHLPWAGEYPPLDPVRLRELTVRAQSGDMAAKEMVILSHSQWAVSQANKLWRARLRSRRGLLVEDLVQEAMAAMFRAFPALDLRRGAPTSFLCTVARNAMLSAAAREERERAESFDRFMDTGAERLHDEVAPALEDGSPEGRGKNVDREAAIVALAVSKLPNYYQRVVALFYGLSGGLAWPRRDIAAVFGISSDQVGDIVQEFQRIVREIVCGKDTTGEDRGRVRANPSVGGEDADVPEPEGQGDAQRVLERSGALSG